VIEHSIPAVKAALHRGRVRLRELAKEPEDLPIPVLAEPECSLLATYVDRFNARDFDAIREMLADEVRLDLVNRSRMNGGGEVGRYFHNYGLVKDWHFSLALVDWRPVLLVRDSGDPSIGREPPRLPSTARHRCRRAPRDISSSPPAGSARHWPAHRFERRDAPIRSGRCTDWIKVKNPNAPAATRIFE
jgi:hypothetical protein